MIKVNPNCDQVTFFECVYTCLKDVSIFLDFAQSKVSRLIFLYFLINQCDGISLLNLLYHCLVRVLNGKKSKYVLFFCQFHQ